MSEFEWSDPQRQSAFPVAKAGYPFIGAAAFATAVFALLGISWAALAGLVVTVCICLFFRDPDRVVPNGPKMVVSPADGKVIKSEIIDTTPYYDGRCRKISIFMSVFNVHVNRVPHEGRIDRIDYHPGKFVSANLDKASAENEHNAVFLRTDDGAPICFVQIAGLVARRILCHVQAGDSVRRGQKFGMICFGSRLDVYLPADSQITVAVGDKVQSGHSVLGVLP